MVEHQQLCASLEGILIGVLNGSFTGNYQSFLWKFTIKIGAIEAIRIDWIVPFHQSVSSNCFVPVCILYSRFFDFKLHEY